MLRKKLFFTRNRCLARISCFHWQFKASVPNKAISLAKIRETSTRDELLASHLPNSHACVITYGNQDFPCA